MCKMVDAWNAILQILHTISWNSWEKLVENCLWELEKYRSSTYYFGVGMERRRNERWPFKFDRAFSYMEYFAGDRYNIYRHIHARIVSCFFAVCVKPVFPKFHALLRNSEDLESLNKSIEWWKEWWVYIF